MCKAEDLDNVYTYHCPSDEQKIAYGEIRSYARSMATIITSRCPQSEERTLALRKLEESVMWANASIARNPNAPTP